MLIIVNQVNRAFERAALRSMFEARKRVFIDLLKWDLPALAGRFELDQFDDEHATYLIVTDGMGEHLASARLLPTTRPALLDTLYPGLVAGDVPHGAAILEITRFCLSPAIIGSFSTLADIIFRSFAGLGITAGGGTIGAEDLLRPGRLAATGFDAAHPLIEQIMELSGPIDFFTNFLTIMVLLIAWVIIVLAFFILAVQLFITIIEFKLTTLAGFALVPFALWGRSAFLAERVLGSVVSSGVKVMVLGVIVGIGSGFLPDFLGTLGGDEPDLALAMSLALASLALLGLGIFGPGIASGLVAGAPQLGAGAAAGTAAAAAGTMVVGGGAALGAVRAGTSMGAAASTAYRLGQESSGSSSVGAGLSGVATAMKGAGAGAARNARSKFGLGEAADAGRNAAWNAGNSSEKAAAPARGGDSGASSSAAPAWAADLKADQRRRAARQAAIHVISDGSRGGSGASPDIAEKED